VAAIKDPGERTAVPLSKRRKSTYWQIRFEVAGVEIRRSSGTSDRRAAQELEEQLRRDAWRQIKLGEQRWTWGDALKRCELEDSHQKSWDRTKRSLSILNEYLSADTQLSEIDYDSLLKIRSLLQLRTSKGHGWKTKRLWKKSTCNRVLAVTGSTLQRCASDEWKNMIPRAPKIPLFGLGKIEPKWITREQAHQLLGRFPLHTRDMTIFSLATGLRKSNVAGLEWERIDLARRCCFVPGYLTKSGDPIPVPLNDDAIEVLTRWQGIHEDNRGRWSAATRRQELGGWATLEMPLRYAHLDPGHLAEYADRTLLGENFRAETGTPDDADLDGATQPIDLNGKGGTRTLDPGIMRAVASR
jgi:integrase